MQTESSASSERTEAESITTEDSGYGDSSVAWIKPQLQTQVPSRLRTQHTSPGSPDICRISCCCGGAQNSTIITTDIPCKDPRTYVPEDPHPVLLVSGQTFTSHDPDKDAHLPVNEGVWVSHHIPTSPTTSQVPEDPEWIRRRVVAVEQQQWNHYLAASSKAGHVVPHFKPYVLPDFTACHAQPNSCSSVPDVHVLKQENLSAAADSKAPVVVGSPSSLPVEILPPSSFGSLDSSMICERGESVEDSDPPEFFSDCLLPVSTPNADQVSTDSPGKEVFVPEKVVELEPPFVKWILVPQDFASSPESVEHVPSKLSQVGSELVLKGSKTTCNKGSCQHPDSCPDLAVQHWHF